MNRWGRWSLRLFGLALMPVLSLALAMGQVWLGAHASAAVMYVAGVLAVLMTGLLLFIAFVLAIADVEFVAGAILVCVACIALSVGASVAAANGDVWLLHWRGVETTCTVVEVHEGQGTAYFGRTMDTSRYSEYELQCEAADAPDTMTTDLPVPGERVRVAYDPGDFGGARPATEVHEAVPSAKVVGIAMAVWTVLTVGVVLRCMPLDRNRRAWPRR